MIADVLHGDRQYLFRDQAERPSLIGMRKVPMQRG